MGLDMNIAWYRLYLFTVSIVMVLVIFIVPVMGAMSAPMNSRDLTGTNMENIDHWNTLVNSALECAELCDATAGCEGATYVLPNTIQGPNAHCWRKSAVTGDVEDFNCISFVRQSAPSGGGCSGVTPIADFSGFPVSGPAPYAVQFTDQSTGAVSWTWDFGDVTTGPENTQQNPLHTYSSGNAQGITYTVKLTISGSCPGQTDTKTRTGYIAVYDNVGVLDLTSVPSGARVFLDSQDFGTTPYKSFVLEGSHAVRLTLSGYNDYTVPVTIVKNQQNKVTATLVKATTTPSSTAGTLPVTPPSSATGTLQITTTPDGAAVYLDGGSKGMSPATLSGLAAGSHTVKLTKAGYTDYQATVTVTGGQTTPLNVKLVAGTSPASTTTTTGVPAGTGSVVVSSSPAGASVNFDGWDKGTTPVTIPQVMAGLHTLTLKKAGYEDAVRTVTVSGGAVAPVAVTLILQGQQASGTGTGKMTVRSTPEGASVYLDGEKIGTTPVTVPGVKAGIHRVLLTLQGYNDNSQTIEISSGSDKEISVDFGPKKTPGFAVPVSLAALVLVSLVLLRRRKGW
jgi:PKD repeat protein